MVCLFFLHLFIIMFLIYFWLASRQFDQTNLNCKIRKKARHFCLTPPTAVGYFFLFLRVDRAHFIKHSNNNNNNKEKKKNSQTKKLCRIALDRIEREDAPPPLKTFSVFPIVPYNSFIFIFVKASFYFVSFLNGVKKKWSQSNCVYGRDFYGTL